MSRYIAILSLCLLGVTACTGSSDITEQSAAAIADTPVVDVPAYERDPFWPPALPDGWVMGTPTSLYVDPRDQCLG